MSMESNLAININLQNSSDFTESLAHSLYNVPEHFVSPQVYSKNTHFQDFLNCSYKPVVYTSNSIYQSPLRYSFASALHDINNSTPLLLKKFNTLDNSVDERYLYKQEYLSRLSQVSPVTRMYDSTSDLSDDNSAGKISDALIENTFIVSLDVSHSNSSQLQNHIPVCHPLAELDLSKFASPHPLAPTFKVSRENLLDNDDHPLSQSLSQSMGESKSIPLSSLTLPDLSPCKISKKLTTGLSVVSPPDTYHQQYDSEGFSPSYLHDPHGDYSDYCGPHHPSHNTSTDSILTSAPRFLTFRSNTQLCMLSTPISARAVRLRSPSHQSTLRRAPTHRRTSSLSHSHPMSHSTPADPSVHPSVGDSLISGNNPESTASDSASQSDSPSHSFHTIQLDNHDSWRAFNGTGVVCTPLQQSALLSVTQGQLLVQIVAEEHVDPLKIAVYRDPSFQPLYNDLYSILKPRSGGGGSSSESESESESGVDLKDDRVISAFVPSDSTLFIPSGSYLVIYNAYSPSLCPSHSGSDCPLAESLTDPVSASSLPSRFQTFQTMFLVRQFLLPSDLVSLLLRLKSTQTLPALPTLAAPSTAAMVAFAVSNNSSLSPDSPSLDSPSQSDPSSLSSPDPLVFSGNALIPRVVYSSFLDFIARHKAHLYGQLPLPPPGSPSVSSSANGQGYLSPVSKLTLTNLSHPLFSFVTDVSCYIPFLRLLWNLLNNLHPYLSSISSLSPLEDAKDTDKQTTKQTTKLSHNTVFHNLCATFVLLRRVSLNHLDLPVKPHYTTSQALHAVSHLSHSRNNSHTNSPDDNPNNPRQMNSQTNSPNNPNNPNNLSNSSGNLSSGLTPRSQTSPGSSTHMSTHMSLSVPQGLHPTHVLPSLIPNSIITVPTHGITHGITNGIINPMTTSTFPLASSTSNSPSISVTSPLLQLVLPFAASSTNVLVQAHSFLSRYYHFVHHLIPYLPKPSSPSSKTKISIRISKPISKTLNKPLVNSSTSSTPPDIASFSSPPDLPYTPPTGVRRGRAGIYSPSTVALPVDSIRNLVLHQWDSSNSSIPAQSLPTSTSTASVPSTSVSNTDAPNTDTPAVPSSLSHSSLTSSVVIPATVPSRKIRLKKPVSSAQSAGSLAAPVDTSVPDTSVPDIPAPAPVSKPSKIILKIKRPEPVVPTDAVSTVSTVSSISSTLPISSAVPEFTGISTRAQRNQHSSQTTPSSLPPAPVVVPPVHREPSSTYRHIFDMDESEDEAVSQRPLKRRKVIGDDEDEGDDEMVIAPVSTSRVSQIDTVETTTPSSAHSANTTNSSVTLNNINTQMNTGDSHVDSINQASSTNVSVNDVSVSEAAPRPRDLSKFDVDDEDDVAVKPSTTNIDISFDDLFGDPTPAPAAAANDSISFDDLFGDAEDTSATGYIQGDKYVSTVSRADRYKERETLLQQRNLEQEAKDAKRLKKATKKAKRLGISVEQFLADHEAKKSRRKSKKDSAGYGGDSSDEYDDDFYAEESESDGDVSEFSDAMEFDDDAWDSEEEDRPVRGRKSAKRGGLLNSHSEVLLGRKAPQKSPVRGSAPVATEQTQAPRPPFGRRPGTKKKKAVSLIDTLKKLNRR